MAFQHGRITAFLLDDSAGALQNISAYLDNVDFPQEVDVPETTSFGDTDRRYGVVGIKSATVSLSGKFDAGASAIDAHLSALIGHTDTQSFEYGPEGSTASNVQYSGECRLQSYSASSPVDGIVTFSAELLVDGTVTRGTF